MSRLLVATAVLLGGCRDGRPEAPSPSATAQDSAVIPGGDPAKQAADLVARLSDEELIGQLLMPYAYGNDADKVTSGSASANKAYAGASTPAEIVRKYHL